MQRRWKHIGQLAALAAFGALIAWTAQAVAQQESSLMVGGPNVIQPGTMPTLPAPAGESGMPTMRPAMGQGTMPMLPAPADVAPPNAAPAPPAPAAQPAAAIRPLIDYRTHLGARRMLRREPQVQVVMLAQNPADGCLYEVPLCIPACCQGAPRVTSDRGRLGRGEVEYCWPCGFEAEVVFRARGDVVVNYRG